MDDETRPPRPLPFDWTFWLSWLLVTTLGWLLGWTFGAEMSVGATMGLLQWLLIRQRLGQRAWWWIFASTAGWAAGWTLALIFVPTENRTLAGAFMGAGCGTAQWLVLRQKVRGAWWWIVISTLSWAVGLTALLGVSLVGVFGGAGTGFAIEQLLRYPLRAQTTQPTVTEES